MQFQGENLIHRFLFSPGWWWLRHLLFWMFMYLDEVLSPFGFTPPLEEPYALLALEFGLDVLIVYINLYILIPFFLLRRKYLLYLLFTFGMLALSSVINFWAATLFYEIDEVNLISVHFSSILFSLGVLGTAVAIKLGKRSIIERQLREDIQNEKVITELNYLKQQVNPHFLFNVLNSLYIQAKTDSTSVPDTVMQLSDLLRYQIYEASEKEKVRLSKEMEFLNNYLKLEGMRRDNLTITWNHDGISGHQLIEPLIFLPLIENAVKHSRSSDGTDSSIEVEWSKSDLWLSLKVINTIGKDDIKNGGGFGIENLRRRLDLTYPKKHNLQLESKDGKFIASLTILLDEMHHN